MTDRNPIVRHVSRRPPRRWTPLPLAALACVLTALPVHAAEPSDFVRRFVLNQNREAGVEKMDAKAFTTFMEDRMLADGRRVAPPAFAGCADPARQAAAGRTFRLDPVHGRSDGDGSAERPFEGLQAFLADPRHPPLRGGDRLLLMSGDHGSPVVNALSNDGFVSIEAAPGSSPRLQSMRIVDARMLSFARLAFEALPPKENRWLLRVEPAASDIVVRDGSFATAGEAAGRTEADWNERSALGILSRGACTAILGNEFHDLFGGVRSDGANALVAGNRFTGIVNDNITFAASGQRLLGNVILTGRNNLSNRNHSDGIQGWTQKGALTEDVVIDGNLVLHYQPVPQERLDRASRAPANAPKLDAGIFRQGISIFDGRWRNVRVTNNVVVTNSSYAIAMLGLTDSEVGGNVVLGSDPGRFPARLRVLDAKNGAPTSNTTVEGNYADELEVSTSLAPRANTVLAQISQRRRPGRDGAGSPAVAPARWGRVLRLDQASAVPGIDGATGVYDVRPNR